MPRDLTVRQLDRAERILADLDRLITEYRDTTDGRSLTDDHDARGEVENHVAHAHGPDADPSIAFRAFLNSDRTPTVLGSGRDSMAGACWDVFSEEVEEALDALGALDT